MEFTSDNVKRLHYRSKAAGFGRKLVREHKEREPSSLTDDKSIVVEEMFLSRSNHQAEATNIPLFSTIVTAESISFHTFMLLQHVHFLCQFPLQRVSA